MSTQTLANVSHTHTHRSHNYSASGNVQKDQTMHSSLNLVAQPLLPRHHPDSELAALGKRKELSYRVDTYLET